MFEGRVRASLGNDLDWRLPGVFYSFDKDLDQRRVSRERRCDKIVKTGKKPNRTLQYLLLRTAK